MAVGAQQMLAPHLSDGQEVRAALCHLKVFGAGGTSLPLQDVLFGRCGQERINGNHPDLTEKRERPNHG